MKNLLTLILSVLLLTGCKKANKDVPPVGKMTAQIGSISFSSTDVTFYGGSDMSIWGKSSNASIGIYVEGYHGVGTYAVGTQWSAPTQYIGATGTQYAKSGQLSVTSTSPLIVGTFSFTCDNSLQVTSGSFTATAP